MSTATEGPQIARLDWIMVGVLGFVWGSTFMVTELASLLSDWPSPPCRWL